MEKTLEQSFVLNTFEVQIYLHRIGYRRYFACTGSSVSSKYIVINKHEYEYKNNPPLGYRELTADQVFAFEDTNANILSRLKHARNILEEDIRAVNSAIEGLIDL